jgi:hypothetical protein
MLSGGQIAVRTVNRFGELSLPSPPEAEGFRRFSLGPRRYSDRELPPAAHDRAIRMSYAAYRMNPLAHRLVEMQTSFVLGNGISAASHHKEVLGLIGVWWNNSYNNWPLEIGRRLRDLYIYGEWIHWPITATNGTTYIRDLQPDSVEALILDGQNHAKLDRVVFKQVYDGSESMAHKAAYVIRRVLKISGDRAELMPYTGDVFYHGINRTTDASRGIGILFPTIDYLDMHDDSLFARAEKIRAMSAVWWDLQMDGKTEEEVRDYLKRETNVPPRPGSVYAHNEAAKLEAKTADLKADDHAVDMAAMKSYIISSHGWPGTWFDDPGSAGRAVGAEMAEPALRNVINLQSVVSEFLRTEINHMLWQASQAGVLSLSIEEIEDRNLFSLTFNRPSARDIQRIGPALARMGQFLESITSKVALLTQEEARAIVVSTIDQLGLSDQQISLDLPVSLKAKAPGVQDPKDPKQVAQNDQDKEIVRAVAEWLKLAA